MKSRSLPAAARAYRMTASFARSRKGGGMLIACAFALSVLVGVGAVMSNYAWREAQHEELRAAVRAALSAAGPLLAGAGGEMDAQIEARVGAFVQALLPDLQMTEVTVAHDKASGVATVTVSGTYAFRNIWVAEGNEETREDIEESVSAVLEVDRYEVAVALDVSSSMRESMPTGAPGASIVRIDGLKIAMNSVLDVMEKAIGTNPGSIMASIVPFGVAVNVADTCNADPGNGRCRADRSAAKERYVRMLAGPHETRGAMLAAARASGSQWVDTFHHYGASAGLGPLWAQSLPADLLDDRDWNLRREDVEIDVSAQVPSLDTGAVQGSGYWRVNHEDFWNGCVMARWGAYWDPKARPRGWDANDPGNWPAAKAVPPWSAGAGELPARTPLHLSDAPPDAADPNTLFTAYSWPDARISGGADYRLQSIMFELVGMNDVLADRLALSLGQADNDWSVREDRGGADLCPPSPLTPLTDAVDTLRAAVDGLETVRSHGRRAIGATFLPLGIVWGLRTVSPLWRNVWQVTDIGDGRRPGTPCAPGESGAGCDAKLNKSILIVSDGANDAGAISQRLVRSPISNAINPNFSAVAFTGCNALSLFYPEYSAAVTEQSEADFNSHFDGFVDASGRFETGRMEPVLDAFDAHLDGPRNPLPEDRTRRETALAGLTPWQIFRGIDSTGGIDALMDPANAFGFDGRPVQTHHFCHLSSVFSPYGRVDDRVRVGHSGGNPSTLLGPQIEVAPLSATFRYATNTQVKAGIEDRLDDWLRESCRIAGLRRVRVNAIYLGGDPASRGASALRECIAEAGGDPDNDLYLTPTSEAVKNAFVDIFTIRRNLRFLD